MKKLTKIAAIALLTISAGTSLAACGNGKTDDKPKSSQAATFNAEQFYTDVADGKDVTGKTVTVKVDGTKDVNGTKYVYQKAGSWFDDDELLFTSDAKKGDTVKLKVTGTSSVKTANGTTFVIACEVVK